MKGVASGSQPHICGVDPPTSKRSLPAFGAVTIEGVGHYPMLEKPDEFNRKLRDVLKEFATRK